MKFSYKKLIYVLILGLTPVGVNAQRVLSGPAADTYFSGAEIVRENNFSSLPSYVKFRESNQMDIDGLTKWMVSNFKFAPGTGFNLLREDVDKLGHIHYRYQQTLNGKPIEDAIWIAHTKNNRVYSVNGLIYDKITAPSTAALTETAALDKALDFVGATIYKWELPGEEEHLKWETGDVNATYVPQGQLVFVSAGNTFLAKDYRLAYKFNIYAHQPVSRAEIYVDANSGEIIRRNELICDADAPGVAHTAYSGEKDIVADSFGGEFRLRDASRGSGIRTFDMNEGTSYGGAEDFIDDDNDWDNVNPQLDEYATDAHWGSEMTYDYFFEEHGRNSIDNLGFQLNSYVHYDEGFDNAFWDGNRMTYGDGSFFFTPLTSIDVAGHEITHGLTTFTAGLIYSAESGALNESFSDIFGTAIEHFGRPEDADWLIGADIGLTGPLRSMSNPNAEGDPDTYFGDFWADLGGGDAGGVHTNSGVQNFWYYLLSVGGAGTNDNGDDYDISGLGIDDASAIAFRNLTVYLTPSSQFADARFYAIQSAIDLFGICTFEVEQTANAWYAVGVGEIYNPVTEADFFASETLGCAVPFTITFNNTSSNASSYEWDFGDGGTSTDENPSHTYTEAGTYSVSLHADGGSCGTDDITLIDYIIIDPDADCIVTLPASGTASVQTGCEGTIFDSGGEFTDYGAGEDAQVTISPYGALNVSLTFPTFDIEDGPGISCDYDYLEIYDGPNIFSPLIGRYCNDNLPTDLTSSGPSVTLLFHSDGGVEEAGFEIGWACTLPEDEPVADFVNSSNFSCNGTVYFVDQSTNSPTSWFWDFGDGGTSTAQNPTHTYLANGVYDVTLTATNVVGSDDHIEIDNITIELTEDPTTTSDNICEDESTTLYAEGASDLNWFTTAVGGTPFHTGTSYTTPVLGTTTTYYVESHTASDPAFVGPEDNTFGGGGFFNGDQHLIFNCPTPVILKSVLVYANGSGNRTIELRESDGSLIESRTINIPNGENRITLDLQLPAGEGLQLGTAVGSSPDLYRNNSGIPDYPYVLPGSVEIATSSAGDEYYYFYYDWEILTYECISDRVPVSANVVNCVGLTEEATETAISIYPNPSHGLININTGELEKGTIKITDVIGKTIAVIPFNANQFSVDLNDFQASGTYFVSFLDIDSNLITIRKIVKQ